MKWNHRKLIGKEKLLCVSSLWTFFSFSFFLCFPPFLLTMLSKLGQKSLHKSDYQTFPRWAGVSTAGRTDRMHCYSLLSPFSFKGRCISGNAGHLWVCENSHGFLISTDPLLNSRWGQGILQSGKMSLHLKLPPSTMALYLLHPILLSNCFISFRDETQTEANIIDFSTWKGWL